MNKKENNARMKAKTLEPYKEFLSKRGLRQRIKKLLTPMEADILLQYLEQDENSATIGERIGMSHNLVGYYVRKSLKKIAGSQK
jgi:DNA-binding CsgD family transcriptional regulator